ncbi:TPA: tyrosine-type DNA invertase IpuB, partial [Escherichia coli]|nr:tyrosine-type DNA invertase IpuB [Escherichia coli]
IVKKPFEDSLFLSCQGNKISRQYVYKMCKKYSHNMNINIHPHMLRHGCGYALANQGLDTRLIQDYLGHRNIHHTVLYTASNAARFKRVWEGDVLDIKKI